jgi:WD40 repeat protein
MPDGCVASGSWDGTIKVWDRETGNVLTMDQHQGPVEALAVFPDGRIASGGCDTTVKLWNPRSNHVQSMAAYTDVVTGVVVLNNKMIVWIGKDGVVGVWDTEINQARTKHHGCPLIALASLGDGRVVYRDYFGVVVVWDPATEIVHTWDFHQPISDPDALAVTAEGEIAFSKNSNVFLWIAGVGEPRHIHRLSANVTVLAAMPDGRVISGDEKGLVKIWDPRLGRSWVFFPHDEPVMALAALRDGRVASGSWDQTVKVWDANAETPRSQSDPDEYVGQARDPRTAPPPVLMRPEGTVFAPTRDGAVKVWDPQMNQAWVSPRDPAWPRSQAILPDGRIITGGDDGTIQVENQRTRSILVLDPNPTEELAPVYADLRGDSNYQHRYEYIGGGPDRSDNRTRACRELENYCHFPGMTAVTAISVLPSARVTWGTAGGMVGVYNYQTKAYKGCRPHKFKVTGLAGLADGRVVSSAISGDIKILDTDNGKFRAIGNGGSVGLLSLPDGRMLWDNFRGDVSVWDPLSGKVQVIDLETRPRQTVSGHAAQCYDWNLGHETVHNTPQVLSMAMLVNGWVVLATWDRTIKVLDPQTGRVLSFMTHVPARSVVCNHHFPRIAAMLTNDELLILEVEPITSALHPTRTREPG